MDSRKNMFYQFISLDMNQVDVVSVSEEAAVRYFIHHATEEEKEVFLKQFSTYIKKYLEISNRDFVKDKNLMFEAYHLYDNYFPVLALFPNYTEKDRVKGSTFYNDIYGRALDLYWSEPANKEEVARELSVDLMKEIREYRMDRDFLKRKDSFLKMYGQVDSKVLKDAYTLYVTKEKSPDQEFFSPDISKFPVHKELITEFDRLMPESRQYILDNFSSNLEMMKQTFQEQQESNGIISKTYDKLKEFPPNLLTKYPLCQA